MRFSRSQNRLRCSPLTRWLIKRYSSTVTQKAGRLTPGKLNLPGISSMLEPWPPQVWDPPVPVKPPPCRSLPLRGRNWAAMSSAWRHLPLRRRFWARKSASTPPPLISSPSPGAAVTHGDVATRLVNCRCKSQLGTCFLLMRPAWPPPRTSPCCATLPAKQGR